MSTDLTIVKLAFMAFVGLLAFLSGIVPTKVPWCKNSINVLGIANAFSGGVFMAIAFIHIMPEVADDYSDYLHPHEHDHTDELSIFGDGGLEHGDGDDDFPLPFLLILWGYAFILMIDKVIFDTHGIAGEHHHGHTHDPVQENFIKNAKSSFVKFQKMVTGDFGAQQLQEDEKVDEGMFQDTIKQYLSRNDKFAVRMSTALHKKKYKNNSSRSFINKDKGLDDDQADLFEDKNNIDLKGSLAKKNGYEHIHEEPPKRFCSWNLTPVVLMIALSTHAVFEGIAVGVESSLSSVWTYLIAITLHKWAAAMSLGVSMSKNFKDENRTIYTLLLIFSLATPLGIGIGMLVQGSSELTNIIFSSLAAGTFVYISCSEVIVEEFSTPHYKWLKLLMFLLGMGLITSLHFIEN